MLGVNEMKKIFLLFLSFLIVLSGCSEVIIKVSLDQPQSSKGYQTENELIATFLDTGTSDCIILQVNDQVIVIDAGDNDDEAFVVNALLEMNIEKIDYLISTHPDADHCGGLDVIADTFPVNTVYVSNGTSETKSYQNFIYELAEHNLTPSVPLEDPIIVLSEITTMQFFNTKAQGKGNDVSLVTLIKHGKNSFLLMADAEKSVEEQLLADLEEVDVLKVGHHGSNTSSSSAFLDVVKPDIAVITLGVHNPYGYPHKETLQRYSDIKTQIYRTDQDGTIQITSDGESIQVETHVELSGIKNAAIIGNMNSHIYHKSDCKVLPHESNRIYFENKQQAENLGYKSCSLESVK